MQALRSLLERWCAGPRPAAQRARVRGGRPRGRSWRIWPAKASALPASNSWFQRNPDLRCDRRAPLRSGRASAPAGAPMCRRKAPLKMEVGLCRPGLTSTEPEDVLEPARPGRAARARTHIHLCGEATIIARGAARISAPRSASAYPGCRRSGPGGRVRSVWLPAEGTSCCVPELYGSIRSRYPATSRRCSRKAIFNATKTKRN